MTAAHDRERGDWIPWYCEDSPGWLELSLAARGAAEGIARKMGPHRGELHLGSRGLRGLAVLLRCSWAELEPALAELTSGPHPRLVVSEDQRMLIDPDHETRRRPTSRERMAKHRAKRAMDTCQGDPDPRSDQIRSDQIRGDVTRVTVTSRDAGDVTGVTSTPPEWWGAVCDTVEAGTGAKIERAAAWLRYSGHRATNGKRMAAPDAQYWLTTVDVREQAADRRREQTQRDLAQQRREGPPKAPAPTPEQSKRFAEELSRRLLGQRNAGGER